MSNPAKAFAFDSESARSLKSPLLATDACPDSELEIEQSNGAALPAPQAGRQLREGCQRPVELSTTERDILEICIQKEESKIRQHPGVDRRSRSVVSIFRVPSFLKVSTKREAYVPKIVSLGPYHHGRAKLKPMEIHKVRGLNRMMMRSNKMDFFRSALVKIWEDKDEFMNSYEEKYDSNPKSLAMMVRDGCFILEILRTLGGDELSPVNVSNCCGDELSPDDVSNCYERIFEIDKIDYTGSDILNDMLKLENQIPFPLLQKLLELGSTSHNNDNLIELVRKALFSFPISKFYPFPLDKNKKLDLQPSDEHGDHFLGLFYSLIVSPDSEKNQDHRGKKDDDPPIPDDVARIPIPCAVKLKNTGIKLKKLNSGGIDKIKYEKGTIHLPPITITDHTEVLFRNLVALELCKPSTEICNYVICYVSLMDELINSGEDVGVLTRNRILTHHLGSDEEVAKLFNGLCTGVTLSKKDLGAFHQLRNGVHNDYNNKMKVHFAQFVNENFSSPWNALALVGAVIGLVLTLVTAVFSILAVAKK